MKNPFKSDPVDRAKKQIAGIEQALAELRKRQSIVERLVDENKAKLRAFVRDNPAADPPAELRQYVIVSREDLEATTDTIVELDEQLGELRAALATEEDRARREVEATELETSANAVDAAAAELRKAVASVAAAAGKMRSALPTNVPIVESRSWARLRDDEHPNRDFYESNELVSAVVAEALAHASPTLFLRRHEGMGSGSIALLRMVRLAEAIPGHRVETWDCPAIANAAELLLSRRLRKMAEAVRSGDELRHRPETSEAGADSPAAPFAGDVEIFVGSPFSYIKDASGRRNLIGARWVHRVPDAVATEAVNRGLALRTDTPEGRAKFEQERTYRETSMSTPFSAVRAEDCEDLGDPCGYAISTAA